MLAHEDRGETRLATVSALLTSLDCPVRAHTRGNARAGCRMGRGSASSTLNPQRATRSSNSLGVKKYWKNASLECVPKVRVDAMRCLGLSTGTVTIRRPFGRRILLNS